MDEENEKKVLQFSDDCDSESENDNSSGLKINKTFANEYEKRKRRQELINANQNDECQIDDDSSSDESEDEVAELLTPKVDLQILKVRILEAFLRRRILDGLLKVDISNICIPLSDNQCIKK